VAGCQGPNSELVVDGRVKAAGNEPLAGHSLYGNTANLAARALDNTPGSVLMERRMSPIRAAGQGASDDHSTYPLSFLESESSEPALELLPTCGWQ
jgi:hypothetical protein